MSVITIDTSALIIGKTVLNSINGKINTYVNDALNANAKEIEGTAKRLAPADRGAAGIRGHISANTKEYLKKIITVNMPYAAYMEFGTGKYAAQYASSLPSDWQSFALQFKGKAAGGGTFKQMLVVIAEWIRRKGIVASFNVQTRKRVGTGRSKQELLRAEQMAYVIARSILINGVHPQPFLYPAYKHQEPQIFEDVKIAVVKAIENTRGNI